MGTRGRDGDGLVWRLRSASAAATGQPARKRKEAFLPDTTTPAVPASDGQAQPLPRRVARSLAPQRLPEPINPALIKQAERRAENVQNRAADRITAFSGSMLFVYVHILWFGLWIGLGVEKYPFGLLTMIVSLEAIFLSTFVLISQNRADAKRQVLANQEWRTVQEEDRQNRQLLALSQQILRLTQEVHTYAAVAQQGRPEQPAPSNPPGHGPDPVPAPETERPPNTQE